MPAGNLEELLERPGFEPQGHSQQLSAGQQEPGPASLDRSFQGPVKRLPFQEFSDLACQIRGGAPALLERLGDLDEPVWFKPLGLQPENSPKRRREEGLGSQAERFNRFADCWTRRRRSFPDHCLSDCPSV